MSFTGAHRVGMHLNQTQKKRELEWVLKVGEGEHLRCTMTSVANGLRQALLIQLIQAMFGGNVHVHKKGK